MNLRQAHVLHDIMKVTEYLFVIFRLLSLHPEAQEELYSNIQAAQSDGAPWSVLPLSHFIVLIG